jgi:hypothetical protein
LVVAAILGRHLAFFLSNLAVVLVQHCGLALGQRAVFVRFDE